jgi:peptide/nickel transport system permease protein
VTVAVAGARSATHRRWTLTPSGLVTGLLVAVFVVLAIAAPTLWREAASRTDVAIANLGPSAEHLLGTDSLGRDVAARTLVATRSSLVLAVLATAVGGGVGVTLGLLSAVVGRRAGRVLGGAINVLIAFPALLLAIFFAVVFGIGSTGSVLAVGAAFAPGFARLTQTLAASVASLEYVQAARILGRGRAYIMTRHILPNVAEPIILYAAMHLGTAILALSGLSFLGLGVQPPAYDWGRLLTEGLARIYTTPVVALAPCLAIVLAGVTFNLAGERLSDAVAGRDPRRAPVRDPAEPAVTSPESAPESTTNPQDDSAPVLEVAGLQVQYPSPAGMTAPVRDVSFEVRRSEVVGIVGESGSGKSLTALAIAQLVDEPGIVRADRLRFLDVDLRGPRRAVTQALGARLAMVFQDPGEALNPAIRVGTHLREPAEVHLGIARPDAHTRALEALRAVAIPEPERRYRQYQHEFSGGMKQRASIAVGLMGEPRLLIADEPTTALDVTVQRQILRLLLAVRTEEDASVLLISHDIAVVSEVCDRVLVMYAGFVVEEADTDTLLATPAHPYTAVLLAASPHMDMGREQRLPTVAGRVPGPEATLPGCYFAPRCPRADERCGAERPPLEPLRPSQKVACWHPLRPGESVSEKDGTAEAGTGPAETEYEEDAPG